MGGDTKHAGIAKNSGSNQHTEKVRISFAVSRWGMIDTPYNNCVIRASQRELRAP